MVGRRFGEKVGRKLTKSSEKNKSMVDKKFGKNGNVITKNTDKKGMRSIKNKQKYGTHSIGLFCDRKIPGNYYGYITKLEGTQDYD